MNNMQNQLQLRGLVFVLLAVCSQVSTIIDAPIRYGLNACLSEQNLPECRPVEPVNVASNVLEIFASHPDSEDSKVDLLKEEAEGGIEQGSPKIRGASDNRPLPGKRQEPTDIPQSKTSSSIAIRIGRQAVSSNSG